MDELLHALRRAFVHDRDPLPLLGTVLVAAALLLLAGRLAAAFRRRRARVARLQQLAEHRGLSPAGVALARRLARRAGAEPFALLTRLDLFEHATAGIDEPGPEVRRLRQALGFDRLPPHAPLLSTRELRPGTALAVGAEKWPGEVVEVDERSFAVELARGPSAHGGEVGAETAVEVPGELVGVTIELTLDHAHEARYRLRCQVLGANPWVGEARRLFLGHDESPLRLQRRAFARVALRGPFELQPLAALVPHAGVPMSWTAELVDVSGGGARVEGNVPLPVGLLGRAAFAVGGVSFEGLRAVVLASQADSAGRWRSHLELLRIPESEQDRLVAAVARLSAQASRLLDRPAGVDLAGEPTPAPAGRPE